MAQEGVAAVLAAALQVDNDVAPRLRVADTVDARHRGDNDDVLTALQRGHCLQAQAVEFVIDLRLFLDEEVVTRDVGLRLVVVVVADEVRDGVMGEEVAELGVELGGQRLVVGQDDGRPLRLLDDVGDGERLARARRAQQRLKLVAAIHAGHQPFDGRRLVARSREVGYQLKIRHSTPYLWMAVVGGDEVERKFSLYHGAGLYSIAVARFWRIALQGATTRAQHVSRRVSATACPSRTAARWPRRRRYR